MRKTSEIKAKLAEIESDERYRSYIDHGPAQVQINAPLALVQVSLKAQRATLKWVLEREGKRT